MEAVIDQVPVGKRIVHVWSVLNDFELADMENRNPVGGPGFCYGMSSAGTYILLGWYADPLSTDGIQIMSRFPGSIIFTNEQCPAYMFQPTNEDIAKLRERLEELKQTVKSVEAETRDQGSLRRRV